MPPSLRLREVAGQRGLEVADGDVGAQQRQDVRERLVVGAGMITLCCLFMASLPRLAERLGYSGV